MRRPLLVLQYPDPQQGRTVAIAATRNPEALQAFKEAVLQEASLASLDWEIDEILHLQDEAELERLSKVLALLIPEQDSNDR